MKIEKQPLFSGWLFKLIRSTSKKDLAFCKICDTDITCGKYEIIYKTLEFSKTNI